MTKATKKKSGSSTVSGKRKAKNTRGLLQLKRRLMTIKINRAVLKKALETNAISQRDFAKKIHVSLGYFSQILCGAQSPSLEIMSRILKALGR